MSLIDTWTDYDVSAVATLVEAMDALNRDLPIIRAMPDEARHAYQHLAIKLQETGHEGNEA